MIGNTNCFLDLDPIFTDYETSAVVLLPVPYEGGVSAGKGAAGAPDAVIEASRLLELYDEVLDTEPYRAGIFTAAPLPVSGSGAEVAQEVRRAVSEILGSGRFPVVLGGDHSITPGAVRGVAEHHSPLGVIQLDAHADLRSEYEGSSQSHACVMARVREVTSHTLQVGIRSMSVEEARLAARENLALFTMHGIRAGVFDSAKALQALPRDVYITVDVDVFDWSVISSTGTPEPGGMQWDEALRFLSEVFSTKNVVGFDVVELSSSESDRNSPFAVAKLIYKMLGFKLASEIARRNLSWPVSPAGPILMEP
ncbi:MAG TPA: agmatinase [Desulfobacteraceae bacterium]|nr:agmatinase [Desulfobacteraceae bacterium]